MQNTGKALDGLRSFWQLSGRLLVFGMGRDIHDEQVFLDVESHGYLHGHVQALYEEARCR